MKSIAMFFFSLMMLFQGTASIWVMAAFYANREYIAKNKCENRLIVENTCQGQCVLMKKLHEEQDRKQEQAELDIKGVQLFVQLHQVFQQQAIDHSIVSINYIPYRPVLVPFGHTSSIFRPPIAPISFLQA